MAEAQCSHKPSDLGEAESARVPQKLVLWRIGASRSTLWRLLKSNPANCPAPIIVKGRAFWREIDIDRLRAALLAFRGRAAFEIDQKRERVFQKAVEAKRKISNPRTRKKRHADARQLNLFS
jgi:predicted DNA-binding transcriptional regulator AlpA